MSKLDKSQLKKRDNVEVLVDKFFGLQDYENHFVVDGEGVFIPHALVIETKAGEYAYEVDDKDQKQNAISRVLEFIDDRTAKLFFTGKYGDEAKKIIEMVGKDIRKPLSGVIAEGENNTKRPLTVSGNNLRLGTGGTDLGPTVTDITLQFNGGTKVYLSLKYGSTLAFANIGVSTLFNANKLKAYNLDTDAEKIIKIFGLSKTAFCETFNNYPHSKKIANHEVDVTQTCNKAALENLLEQMVGKGYWMIHGTTSKVNIYEMDDSYLRSATTLTGKITAYYGGTTGKGKKVIVACESAKYKFQFNIRNKASGVAPTHIMCDYQKK